MGYDSSTTNRLRAGEEITCFACGHGVYRPLNPVFPAKENHYFICDKCGDAIHWDSAIDVGRITDDELIQDIRKVAASLNSNKISLEAYLENGGMYPKDVVNHIERGGFANLCALAGLKVTVED